MVGFLLHRELTWEGLITALTEAVVDNGLIMLIIVFSGMVGYAIIFEQAPQTIAQGMLGLTREPILVVLLILLFVFIAGLFVESTVLVLLLTPIFVPLAAMATQLSQELLDRQVQLFILLRKLVLRRLECGERRGKLCDQGMTGRHIRRQ